MQLHLLKNTGTLQKLLGKTRLQNDLLCVEWDIKLNSLIHHSISVKPGFHYPSWQPELRGDRFPLPVNMGRVDRPSTPLVETRIRQHGPCWRVMETGHPSTRVVETGL